MHTFKSTHAVAALLLLVAAPAVAQAPGSTELRQRALAAALSRILTDEWLPEPTEPVWLDLKSGLDAEVAARPAGKLAQLARRAAARVDIRLDSLISQSAHVSTLHLDTRPWLALGPQAVYAVDLLASLDGGPWALVASASSGTTCSARTIDVAWAEPIELGYRHIQLIADLTYVAALSGADAARCGFHSGSGNEDRIRNDRATASGVIDRERRVLPALSFGLFDTRRSITSAREAGGVWTAQDRQDPLYDAFIRRAHATPASALDNGLPDVPFERWLTRTLGPFAEHSSRVEWTTAFCNEEEALWYPGDSAGRVYWSVSSKARRQRRDLCVSAISLVRQGRLLLSMKVGALLEDTGEWEFVAPAFYSARIEGDQRGTDVRTLSALQTVLSQSPDSWPSPEVSVTTFDISYTPGNVAPGQPIVVRAEIRNVGGRTIPWAHGTLWVDTCCVPIVRISRDFYGAIPAAGSVKVERGLTLPTGGTVATVCVSTIRPGGAAGMDLADGGPGEACASRPVGGTSADTDRLLELIRGGR